MAQSAQPPALQLILPSSPAPLKLALPVAPPLALRLSFGYTVPGPPGVQGPAGATGAQGVAGVDASGITGINAKSPPAGMTSAKCDGTTDDTAALQAEISYCQDHSLPLLLPPGIYRLTAPLHVSLLSRLPSETGYQNGGFRIKGLGLSGINQTSISNGIVAPETATLLMNASAQKAIIQVDAGVNYYNVISDVTLDGGADSQATQYALWAPYQSWSGLRLDNVIAKGVDTDVAMTGTSSLGALPGPTGGNGEELDCYSCHFNARRQIYFNSSNSGQAYLHHFFACSCYTSLPGGVAFEIGNSNGGCQCDFYGTSLTMTAGGSVPNVFFQDDGTNDPINWWGGRAEQVDTIIKWNGGSGAQTGHVNIQGMSFPVGQGRGPLFSGGGTNSNYFFTLRSCYFQNNGTPVALGFTYGGGGFERIKMDECDFLGWSDLTALTGNSRTTFSDCRSFDSSTVAHLLVHN